MREWMVCLMLIGACGGDDGGMSRPDAAPPYNLAWNCEVDCGSMRPNLTQTITLDITGLDLAYGGGPGGAVHRADEIDGEGCYVVPSAVEPQGPRQAYRLCPVGLGMEAHVRWHIGARYPGWRVQAWR